MVVVIDVNNCIVLEVYIIDELNVVFVVQNIDVILIDQGLDGVVNLQVNGGIMLYIYSWIGLGNFNFFVFSFVNFNEQGEYCVIIIDVNDCMIIVCVVVE